MKAFTTWVFKGRRFIAVDDGQRARIIDDHGCNYGSWMSGADGFRKRQQKGDLLALRPIGMARLDITAVAVNRPVIVAGLPPAEYAALWGCDCSYDKAPNEPGDGALFYNFGSEKQAKDTAFLTKFLGAIDRTLSWVRVSQPEDSQDLEQLRAFVVGMLHGQEVTA